MSDEYLDAGSGKRVPANHAGRQFETTANDQALQTTPIELVKAAFSLAFTKKDDKEKTHE